MLIYLHIGFPQEEKRKREGACGVESLPVGFPHPHKIE